MVPALLIIGLLYLAYESGALAQFGVQPPGNQAGSYYTSQSPYSSGGFYSAPGYSTGVTLAPSQPPTPMESILPVAVGTLGAAASSPAMGGAGLAALGVSGAAAGAATLGIGAAVAIFTVLWNQHLVRKKQATSENSSMNVGVAGWDSDMRTINQYYNSHQIDAATAIKAIQQALYQYWQIVTPYIQPGRNGCQGGALCTDGVNHCQGSFGAGCCVGCDNLLHGANDAIAKLTAGGGTSTVPTVYGSKYGGQQRNSYTLIWNPVGA